MTGFSPVTNNKLYIQIYNQIRDAIIQGRFKVGDKLPSEKELCEMFGVSRVPVREALSALELNGLVESVHGAGVYVIEPSVYTHEWAGDVDPHDIIVARKLIEPEIARCAALGISEDEKQRMREIIESFRAEAENNKYSEDTDRDFHMCIARASGNQLYIAMSEMIWKAMRQRLWSHILARTVTAEDNLKPHFSEHYEIASAILSGDSDRAYSYMKEHMDDLERRYWG